MRRHTSRTALRLEALEDRTVPTAFNLLDRNAILVGMLRPVSREASPAQLSAARPSVNIVTISQARVIDWLKVGPQPEPPTRPAPVYILFPSL